MRTAPVDPSRGARPWRPLAARLAALAAAAVLLGGTRMGASAEPGESLTLEGALQRAEEVSEEIRIARSQAAAAATERRVARSYQLPNVSATIDYERVIRSPFTLSGLPDDVRLPYGRRNLWWGGFGLDQLLFDAGAASAGVRIAEESSSVARLSALEVVDDVRLAVIEAYLAASLAKRELEAFDATARSIAAQRDALAARLPPGDPPPLDAERAATEADALGPVRVEATNRLERALGRLGNLLNLPPGERLLLADDPLAAPPALPAPAELDRLLAAADRRPALEAGTRSVTVGEQAARAAHAALFPTVTLSARFGGWAAPDETIPQRVDFHDDWSAALTASVAVFDWGRGRAREAAAREGASQARLELARLQERLAFDVRQGRLELERAVALATALAPATGRAERVHETLAAAYRSGQATHLDLAQARTVLQAARIAEATARHDAHLARARFQRAAGVSPALGWPASSSPPPAPEEVRP